MPTKIRLADGTEYEATIGKDEVELSLYIKEEDFRKVFQDFTDVNKTLVMTKIGDGAETDISGYTRFHSMVVDTPQAGTLQLRLRRLID